MNTYGSSIADYLINNRNSTDNFSVDSFFMLSRSLSNNDLNILEVIYILSTKTSICKWKDFVLSLQLISIQYIFLPLSSIPFINNIYIFINLNLALLSKVRKVR